MKKWEPIAEVGLGMNSPYSTTGELSDDLQLKRQEFFALDDEDEQVKHIYAVAGLALYHAQCFEAELQNVILIVGKAKGKLMTIQAWEVAEAKLTRKTLSPLLDKLQEEVKIEENGRQLLELALEKRNSLAHGFFQRYSLEFSTKNGKIKILDDLLKRIALFRKADEFAGIITKMMMKHIGITEDMITEEIDKLQK